MKVKRQKTLSFKVTEAAEAMLLGLQVALTAKLSRPVSKTDVVEEALLLLAKREKVFPLAARPGAD
jgi:hypothetical protein